jgi:hypothetical protein
LPVVASAYGRAIQNHNNLVFRATLHRHRLRHHSPTLPSLVLVAMATIAKELHDGLVTVLDKLNTMVAVLQRIDAEQQDCIYKLEVMVDIQLADAKPPPTPLSLLLPTPSLASTNLVQSPLEMMNAMPTLHPDLQRIGDEQQPMSMDGLPALHPDLQQIIDK